MQKIEFSLLSLAEERGRDKLWEKKQNKNRNLLENKMKDLQAQKPTLRELGSRNL